jgi:hypothetical protein
MEPTDFPIYQCSFVVKWKHEISVFDMLGPPFPSANPPGQMIGSADLHSAISVPIYCIIIGPWSY